MQTKQEKAIAINTKKSQQVSAKYLDKDKKIKLTKKSVTQADKTMLKEVGLDSIAQDKAHRLAQLASGKKESVSMEKFQKFQIHRPVEKEPFNTNLHLLHQNELKNQLKVLHTNNKDQIMIYDMVAQKKVPHSPDDVHIRKLKNNGLALVADSPFGDNKFPHQNHRIIGLKSPDGTSLLKHFRVIHSDKHGLGYEPKNSLSKPNEDTRELIFYKQNP